MQQQKLVNQNKESSLSIIVYPLSLSRDLVNQKTYDTHAYNTPFSALQGIFYSMMILLRNAYNTLTLTQPLIVTIQSFVRYRYNTIVCVT